MERGRGGWHFRTARVPFPLVMFHHTDYIQWNTRHHFKGEKNFLWRCHFLWGQAPFKTFQKVHPFWYPQKKKTIINFVTVLVRCDICRTYINHFLLIVKSLLVCSNPSVSDSIEGRSVFSSHLHHSPTSTHHQPAQHLRPKWVICGLAAWDLINLMPRLPPW